MVRPLLRHGVLALLAVSSAAAMVFDSYDPDRHERFDSGAFLGAPFDWSGVGWSSDGRWATLIDRDVILCANHLRPADGTTVTFWATNTLASPTAVDRTVLGGTRIGLTDLWVGLLDAEVPATISAFPLATGTAQSNLGQTAFTAGLVDGRVAVGRNVLDLYGVNPVGPNGTSDIVGFIQDLPGDANFIPQDETFLQSGDSGGPTLVPVDGSLVLVGLHSFIVNNYQASLLKTRNLTVDSYPGSYADEIAAAVALIRPVLVPAPVPALPVAGSALGALLFGLLGWRGMGRGRVR